MPTRTEKLQELTLIEEVLTDVHGSLADSRDSLKSSGEPELTMAYALVAQSVGRALVTAQLFSTSPELA
jgi:hypothetical protein